MEKLKAQLLQKQCDLTGVFQAFEEYKEITRWDDLFNEEKPSLSKNHMGVFQTSRADL